MPLIIIFLLYQTTQLLLLPAILIYLLLRIIKKKTSTKELKERFGLITKTNRKQHNVIWIHAVSVGEILSVQNLIDQIKKNSKVRTEQGRRACYVTTGTRAGKKIAKKKLNADYISYLPYDFLLPMLMAFKRIKPIALIIVEAETWPNLLMLAKIFSIPAYSINARISSRSKKRYHQLKFILKPLLSTFKTIFTQSDQDSTEFEKLGINRSKLTNLGNIKALNVLVKKEHLKNYKSKQPANKALLVGSVHPGEIDTYLNMYQKLKIHHQTLKLIIAPRHFHWKNELVEKVKSLNYNFYLWETGQLNTQEITNLFEQNDILLVCKLGELFSLYNFCDIFCLGGTFVPVGGHNLLEPAVWQKPSIIGPYYQNCKDIADKLEKKDGLIKVKNEQELFEQTRELLKDEKLLHSMGNNAKGWLTNEAIFVQEKLKTLIREL